MRTVAIDGVIRRYDWGSTTAIQNMLGQEPDGRPAAELWLGAHPDDPATVPEHDSTLDALIAADPDAALGRAVVDRFGPRLPFLVKVLAAGRPLSMQVHPDLAQAQAGFAAEEAAGIAPDARERRYHDPNHKPELLCALTPFDALCGFRPVDATLALLAELALPELDFLRTELGGADPLRAAFTAVLDLADPADVVAAVSRRIADEAAEPFRTLARTVLPNFPGDIGIVLGLLLNKVRLQPGEAVFLGAGNVHSYLAGTGVEILANSDNVLRCGLTPKHVDVPEVLRITDFAELAEPSWPAHDGEFRVPVPDFRLQVVDAPTDIADAGPRIVLCTSGEVVVDGVRVTPGRAAFVPDAAGAVRMDGTGHAFVATVGLD